MKKYGLLLLLFLSLNLYSQERPYRLGFKIGSPNVISTNFEYCTPLLGNRFAPTIDLSLWSLDYLIENSGFAYYYFELGVNYYMLQPGKGLYGGFSYAYETFQLVDTQEFLYDGELHSDKTTYRTTGHMLNFKIGYLIGNFIYFRPELGFSFNSSAKRVILYEGLNESSGPYPNKSGQYIGTRPISLLLNLGFGCKF